MNGGMLRALAARVIAATLLAAAAGCGGGGNSGNQPPPTAPSGLSYPNPQTFVVGEAIDPLGPTVTGTVTSYSASPALPPGITLDPSSGEIAGTPTALTATAVYTITGQNSLGSTAFDLTATVAGVDVLSNAISRMVFSGTSIAARVTILPRNFEIAGTLVPRATDADGVFAPDVFVEAVNGGAYTLTLSTSASAPIGHRTGELTLELCADAACSSFQAVRSVAIEFTIDVLDAPPAWTGDHLTALEPWPDVPDWTMFQGNAAHTGHVPATVDPNRFSTRWRVAALPLASGFYERLGTPVTYDGRLFIAGDNRLFARSEFDGQELGAHSFNDLEYPSVNPPAISNGVVYLAAGQQSSTFMFAFDAAAGSPVFQSPMHSQWEHYLAPTIGDVGIYANSGTYGGLFAFDATGTEMYFEDMAQTSLWTPAVDDTGVYSYTGGALTVNDPASGVLVASVADPTFQNYIYEIGGSPVLGAPGSVFVANYLNSILNGGDIGNTLIKFVTSGAPSDGRSPGCTRPRPPTQMRSSTSRTKDRSGSRHARRRTATCFGPGCHRTRTTRTSPARSC